MNQLLLLKYYSSLTDDMQKLGIPTKCVFYNKSEFVLLLSLFINEIITILQLLLAMFIYKNAG